MENNFKNLSQEKKEKKCYFQINEAEDAITYFFSLDDSGNPNKLGDGTFGVVYKVYDKTKTEYAVKLLYNSKTIDISTYENFFKTKRKNSNEKNTDTNTFMQDEILSAAVKRFEQEMQSARIIKDKLRGIGESSPLDGVVEIIGGTREFTKYPAYEYLKEKFEEMQIEISKYALVMPLYEYTLKDILEKGRKKYKIRRNFDKGFDISAKGTLEGLKRKIFSSKDEIIKELSELLIANNIEQQEVERIKQSAMDNLYEVSGYDILDAINLKERVSTILPYLDDIATGLTILYRAELFHYDIKPANIFIRSNLNKKISSAIGDLGFLTIANTENTSAVNIQYEIPLGTLHYRSPEQKDYYDLCEVEVIDNIDTKNEGNGDSLSLIVHDPKFSNTIIEPGDYVVFAKDLKKIRHKISHIETSGDTTRIILKKSNEYLINTKADQKTQVILYKNYGVRTDLYGFGAIVYDMLTCGKSPERFYDNIRTYDGEYTVDDIKNLYQKVSSYQLNEPRITNIFNCFKNNYTAEYAPIEIVEIILKCILYKSKGTYSQMAKCKEDHNKENHNYEAVDMLKKDLDLLIKNKKLNLNVEASRNKNMLYLAEVDDIEHQDDSKKISNILLDLQKLNKIEQFPLRLARGIWYLSRLCYFIKEKIFEKNNSFIFAEMLPDNVRFNPDKIEFDYYLYQEKEKYIEDLKNDELYTKITRNSSYFFVPSKIAYIRREIDLFREKDNIFSYIFHDSSPFGDQVEKNDWIVYKKRLFKIIDISDDDKLSLKELDPSSKNCQLSEGNKETFKCIYYVDLKPSWYYMNMLGIYLYQFFFVGFKNLTKSKPVLMNILESFSCLQVNYINNIDIFDVSNKVYKKKEKNLELILHALTTLYLNLSLAEIETSIYNNYEGNDDLIIAVLSDIDEIKKMIADFLDIKSVQLDSFPKDIASNQLNAWLHDNENSLLNILDINYWILKSTNIKDIFKTK